jgi:hypothetical protein
MESYLPAPRALGKDVPVNWFRDKHYYLRARLVPGKLVQTSRGEPSYEQAIMIRPSGLRSIFVPVSADQTFVRQPVFNSTPLAEDCPGDDLSIRGGQYHHHGCPCPNANTCGSRRRMTPLGGIAGSAGTASRAQAAAGTAY